METLNKNNYEAYYLDFLEGNLNEEDTSMLFLFLENNPELKLEDEMFEALESNFVSLDSSFKNSLKQVSLEKDSITINTIDSFLIGHVEQILTENKEVELEKFIQSNPSFISIQKNYLATKLKPNKAEIFDEKSSLKKGKKRVLWSSISIISIAASFVLLFGLVKLNTPSIENIKTASHHKTVKNSKKQFISAKKLVFQSEIENKKEIISKDNNNSTSLFNEIKGSKIEENLENENYPVNQLAIQEVKVIDHSFEQFDPELASIHKPKNKEQNKPVQNNYTYLGFNDMKNPIEPVTNQLASIIKKDIDFRRAKPTKKHSGGFYLKIGKIIISRKIG
jgi:hypothetical protein